jgi:multiphosphoryl transfer protein
VSHSAALAEGVVELAREMAGADVALEAAGGLDEPGRPLGTDASLIAAAIDRADSGAGVLVLMDIGSALLSAETALELLEVADRTEVVLSAAPLAEGAVGAAAAARGGATLAEVAREAERGLEPKIVHLQGESESDGGAEPEVADEGQLAEVRVVVASRQGLHARPAARFVGAAAAYDAEISVSDVTTGKGPANARSLIAVTALGVRGGHEIAIRARGPEAGVALRGLETLVRSGLEGGEADEAAREAAR